MEEILQDVSELVVIKAIEDNFFALLAFWGSGPGAKIYDGAEILWIAAPVPSPSHRAVCRTRLSAGAADRRIKEVITSFSPDYVPMAWWVGPSAEPADLGERLIKHGFHHSYDIPGMALDLRTLPEELLLIPGLEVRHVENERDLEKWVYAEVAGYNAPRAFAEGLLNYDLSRGFDQDLPSKRYIALLFDEPVASLELFFHSGVAGIYSVATIPRYRRQGIGTALTLEALWEARDLGYMISILQSTKMGRSVYERLGFKEYCQVSLYLYSIRKVTEA